MGGALSRVARGRRCWWLIGLLLLASVEVATAADESPQLAVHVHVLQYQKVDDAVELVYRLLSEDGTVELRPGGSSLVIRDTIEALARIVPVLDDFDHPLRAMRLELQIVRAASGERAEPPPAELSEEVSSRLRQLLRFDRFAVLSQGSFTAREGEEVEYRMGDIYAVAFRLGTVMSDERLKLQGFRLQRRELPQAEGRASAEADQQPLIYTHLNLWLGEPLVLGLSRAEASDDALMVIVTANPEVPATAVAERGAE